jgi:hypothetical protein
MRRSGTGSVQEMKEEGEVTAPPLSVHPWLAVLPSLATIVSYLRALSSLFPLLSAHVELFVLYFRLAVRHLASRAPDSLEVAHRVISERAMKPGSVIDSTSAVKRRTSHRELLKKKKKEKTQQQPTQHSHLASQLAQVYSSIQRAKAQVLHPHHAGPPVALGVPSAVAVGLTGRVGQAGLRRGDSAASFSVEESPRSPGSVGEGGSGRWEDDEDTSSDGEGDSDVFETSSDDDI